MEWKTVKLGDCLTVKYGKDHKLLKDGNIPVYGSGGIMRYADKSFFDGPSILIPRKGSLNNIMFSEKPFWTVDTMFWTIIDTSVADPKFLYYNLVKKDFAGLNVGSAVPSLTVPVIEAIELSLPSLSEQRRIAAILSSLDAKIENNNRINANLDAQALAIFDAWYGEETNTIKLSEVSLNVTDGVHNTVVDDKEGEYLLLSCKNIVGGQLTISQSERRINKDTFDKLRKRTKLAQGDILVSTVGTVGEIVMLFDEPTHIEFQRSVGLIKPNKEKTTSAYIYCALLRNKNALKHIAHGAVQQCIFIGDLKNFEIPYSSIKKTLQFNAIVAPIFSQIASNIKESQRLVQLRDTLLPKLMKGEIDLA